MATTLASLEDEILEFVRHFEELNEDGIIVRITADVADLGDVGFQFTIETGERL